MEGLRSFRHAQMAIICSFGHYSGPDGAAAQIMSMLGCRYRRRHSRSSDPAAIGLGNARHPMPFGTLMLRKWRFDFYHDNDAHSNATSRRSRQFALFDIPDMEMKERRRRRMSSSGERDMRWMRRVRRTPTLIIKLPASRRPIQPHAPLAKSEIVCFTR